MQPPAFFAEQGALDDEVGHGGDVAEFEKVGRDLEIPIILIDFIHE